MAVEKKGITLPGTKQREEQKDSPPAQAAMKAKSKAVLMDYDTNDDVDEDDDVLAAVPNKGKSPNNLLFIVIGAILVVVLVLVFLFTRGGDSDVLVTPTPYIQTTPAQDIAGTQTPTAANPGLGTQDFGANTNMTNSDVLTNPDKYVQDIYGLTTRVDYTVESISSVADFVSYTKHRGTWGGGLELYWLDVMYKEQKYVMQVPFEYYKELDEMGIVPVRMEVLTIKGSAADEYLSVISYMCLDEDVLEDILNQQNR